MRFSTMFDEATGKLTTLQVGDVLLFEKEYNLIKIVRGSGRLSWGNRIHHDDKDILGVSPYQFEQMAQIIAITHGFRLQRIGGPKDCVTFTFLAR
jgi:hypothetical protein